MWLKFWLSAKSKVIIFRAYLFYKKASRLYLISCLYEPIYSLGHEELQSENITSNNSSLIYVSFTIMHVVIGVMHFFVFFYQWITIKVFLLHIFIYAIARSHITLLLIWCNPVFCSWSTNIPPPYFCMGPLPCRALS